MYSWEITEVMERHNYNLPSHVYLDIARNSPQISKITYLSWNERFEVWDNEGSYWNFAVYCESA